MPSNDSKYNLEPFQKMLMARIGPFNFPDQLRAKIVGAVYVISRVAPPTWFQLEFRNLHRNILTSKHFDEPILVRKGLERPQVAFIQEE